MLKGLVTVMITLGTTANVSKVLRP